MTRHSPYPFGTNPTSDVPDLQTAPSQDRLPSTSNAPQDASSTAGPSRIPETEAGLPHSHEGRETTETIKETDEDILRKINVLNKDNIEKLYKYVSREKGKYKKQGIIEYESVFDCVKFIRGYTHHIAGFTSIIIDDEAYHRNIEKLKTKTCEGYRNLETLYQNTTNNDIGQRIENAGFVFYAQPA